MVNYENGKIYKLYSPSRNIVYFGSTAEPYLSRRLQAHLGNYRMYKNNNNNKRYTSFDVLECDDYKIELVEEIKCSNVEQLRERERFYIENNDCVNKQIPNRSKKEFCKEWNKNNQEYFKKYYEKNKEYIIEYRSQKITCECGCEITKWNLSRHIKSQKHIKLLNN